LRPVEFEWNELAYRKFTAGVEDRVRSVEGNAKSDADLWETERRKIRQEREGTHRGFIAQEVEQVFPEWIETDSEGYRQIDSSELCSVLVKAVQELHQQVISLKSEIATLRTATGQSDGSMPPRPRREPNPLDAGAADPTRSRLIV
jgi:hypothetical protein